MMMRKCLSMLLVLCLVTGLFPALNNVARMEAPEGLAVVDAGELPLDVPELDGDAAALLDDAAALEVLLDDGEDADSADGEAILFDEEILETAEPAEATKGANALTLGVKETYTLTVKNAKYKSSKAAVAAVSAKGVITAKKKGTATVTATVNGKTQGTWKVTVLAAPKKVEISKATLTLNVGATYALSATLPKDTASNKLTWASGNKKVATVDGNGVITAKKAGKAKITVTTFNKKKAICTLTVKSAKAPKKVSFAEKTLTLGVKESATVTPVIDKGTWTSYTWTSKNAKVATVDGNGRITGVKAGTTKVTVKTLNKLTATLTVKVLKAPTKVTLNKKTATLKPWKTLKLKATLPKGTASRIRWSSDNSEVATVDAEGLVTSIAPGKAKITALAFNGKKAVCTVTVSKVSNGADTIQGGMDALADNDTSLMAAGRVEDRHDMLAMSMFSNSMDQDIARDANVTARAANDHIDSYNEEFDRLNKDLNQFDEDFQDTVRARENNNAVTYSMGDMDLVVDRVALDTMASNTNFTVANMTENGNIKLVSGNKVYYISATPGKLFISVNAPNALMRNATNAYLSNGDAVGDTVKYFKEKSDWINKNVDGITAKLRRMRQETVDLQKANGNLVGYYSELAQSYPEDAVIAQALQRALNEDTRIMGTLHAIDSISGALAAVNIAGEAASIRDIATKFEKTYEIERHGHPTVADVNVGNEALAAKLNNQIKIAYSLYLGSCTLSLVSIAGAVSCIMDEMTDTAKMMDANLTVALSVSSVPVARVVDGVYNDVRDLDDELHDAARGIAIDELHFPDANFRAIVAENYDEDNDMHLSVVEIGKVDDLMDLADSNIASLTGIEYFTAARGIDCGNNALSSLDVSGCTALQELYCYGNQLTSLDLSGRTGLQVLECDSNQLTTLKVAGCSSLRELFCESNQLTSLDLTGCGALTALHCDGNQLTSLDLTGCTGLSELFCKGNLLSSVNISGCTALTSVNISGNQLTGSFSFSGIGTLTELDCSENQLTGLDVANCAALTGLYCDTNLLSSLNVSGCTALQFLYCDENQLTSLDVAGCSALQELHCAENNITELTVGASVELSCDDTVSVTRI